MPEMCRNCEHHGQPITWNHLFSKWTYGGEYDKIVIANMMRKYAIIECVRHLVSVLQCDGTNITLL